MPKYAAIEFDGDIARVLVAKTTGTSFQISSAFDVAVENSAEGEGEEFGRGLAQEIGKKVGRCEALISFGRGLSELRVINVPVVPDNELPEIVKFQAIRQFSNSTDDAPVDFLPLNDSADEKRVLAATIPKATLEDLKSVCTNAGLMVKSIKLRATCTTALSQSINPDRKNYIIVDPSENSFNLEVVSFGKLCLTRTVRSAPGDQATQIVREIRRTLAAAKNQVAEFDTKSIVVFGDEANFTGLRSQVETDLQFDVDFINPFDHVKGLSVQPEKPGRFASLVGLLTAHCGSSTNTIDFLNPRKKTTDKGDNRVKMLAAIAVSVLVVGLCALAYLMLSMKSSKIAKIEAEIQSKVGADKDAQELIGDIEQIESFENEQAIWLKELANLSEKFMQPDHAILNSATFTLNAGRKDASAKIDANGFLQSGELSEMLGKNIREKEGYDAKLENVVMITDKERDQDIYSHKFKVRVNRPPVLDQPILDEKKVQEYMEPRAAIGQKELEAAKLALGLNENAEAGLQTSVGVDKDGSPSKETPSEEKNSNNDTEKDEDDDSSKDNDEESNDE